MRARLFLLALPLTFASPAPATADEAGDIAVKVTAAGAKLFDARDAEGLALTYTDDARLDVYIREKGSPATKAETRTGRDEIRAYYRTLVGQRHFKGERATHARSTIEYARMLGPDMVLFAGIFDFDPEGPYPLKMPFTQVRVKKGDGWQIVNLQVFVTLPKSPGATYKPAPVAPGR